MMPPSIGRLRGALKCKYTFLDIYSTETGGKMVPKLKIIPLGGLGEIGKNMTVFEYGNDIIIVDAGMGFPRESMYGVDVVYPDISYLKANAEKVRGLV